MAETPTFPASVLEWLRAGYPEGVPPKDRFPLVALLRRAELTEAQVQQVVLSLVSPIGGALNTGSPNTGSLNTGEITEAEITAYIRELTDHEPTSDEIARVSARLAAGGWPLADPTTVK